MAFQVWNPHQCDMASDLVVRTNFGLAYRECLTKRASACRLVAIHVACPKTAGLRLSQEFKAEPAEWADQEQSNMNVLF